MNMEDSVQQPVVNRRRKKRKKITTALNKSQGALNVSIRRQTLMSNNQALAKALENAQLESKLFSDQIVRLQREKQELQAEVCLLKKLMPTQARSDGIDPFREIKALLHNIASTYETTLSDIQQAVDVCNLFDRRSLSKPCRNSRSLEQEEAATSTTETNRSDEPKQDIKTSASSLRRTKPERVLVKPVEDHNLNVDSNINTQAIQDAATQPVPEMSHTGVRSSTVQGSSHVGGGGAGARVAQKPDMSLIAEVSYVMDDDNLRFTGSNDNDRSALDRISEIRERRTSSLFSRQSSYKPTSRRNSSLRHSANVIPAASATSPTAKEVTNRVQSSTELATLDQHHAAAPADVATVASISNTSAESLDVLSKDDTDGSQANTDVDLQVDSGASEENSPTPKSTAKVCRRTSRRLRQSLKTAHSEDDAFPAKQGQQGRSKKRVLQQNSELDTKQRCDVNEKVNTEKPSTESCKQPTRSKSRRQTFVLDTGTPTDENKNQKRRTYCVSKKAASTLSAEVAKPAASPTSVDTSVPGGSAGGMMTVDEFFRGASRPNKTLVMEEDMEMTATTNEPIQLGSSETIPMEVEKVPDDKQDVCKKSGMSETDKAKDDAVFVKPLPNVVKAKSTNSATKSGSKSNFSAWMAKPGKITYTAGRSKELLAGKNANTKKSGTLPKPVKSKTRPNIDLDSLPSNEDMFSYPAKEKKAAPRSEYDISLSDSTIQQKPTLNQYNERQRLKSKEANRLAMLNKGTVEPGIIKVLGDGTRLKAVDKDKQVRILVSDTEKDDSTKEQRDLDSDKLKQKKPDNKRLKRKRTVTSNQEKHDDQEENTNRDVENTEKKNATKDVKSPDNKASEAKKVAKTRIPSVAKPTETEQAAQPPDCTKPRSRRAATARANYTESDEENVNSSEQAKKAKTSSKKSTGRTNIQKTAITEEVKKPDEKLSSRSSKSSRLSARDVLKLKQTNQHVESDSKANAMQDVSPPKRARRAASIVNYKEPSVAQKLRRGDSFFPCEKK